MMQVTLSKSVGVRWGVSAVKLVADGNSITAGTQDGAESNGGVTGWLSRHTFPFTTTTYSNVAIGGQNTDAMISSAADVDGAYDAAKVNVLVLMEGTNQLDTTSDNPAQAADKLFTYMAARRAAHPWASIVACTCPPVYYGDQKPQSYTDNYNAKLDLYNDYLRSNWKNAADGFVDIRVPGSPYAQSRYPNYLKATFFDATVVDGISNTASYITEPEGGAVPNCKIHFSAAGIAALAPFVAAQLLRVRRRL